MKKRAPQNPSQLSMADLFRVETETQAGALTAGLLELERGRGTPEVLEALMRAAHSLKGAARMVGLPAAVLLAHAMEDCFVAAQRGELQLERPDVDLLLRCVDLLGTVTRKPEPDLATWETEQAQAIKHCVDALNAVVRSGRAHSTLRTPGETPTAPAGPDDSASRTQVARPEHPAGSAGAAPEPSEREHAASGPIAPAPVLALERREPQERVVRLAAESLNRLLGLAGESLVESRWLRPFAESLQRAKRQQNLLTEQFSSLRQLLEEEHLGERTASQLQAIGDQLQENRQFLADRLQELDLFDRRSAHLSHRLYLEVLRTRMRPFSEGVRRFPRMVRDLARSLGKEVRLEIAGESTPVDRELLERLETPLVHLLRNAVDHGCETAEARRRAGKPPECTLRLEARHSAGMLLVGVSDDGRGVDPAHLRQVLEERNLVPAGTAPQLPEPDLLNFLFLPGFSLKSTVTEISGRGVGLDVVQNMIRSVRGSLRVTNQPGRGFRVQLQLPLTLSVIRTLLVEVAGEPYAVPLNQIVRAMLLNRSSLKFVEGRPHFQFGDQRVGLLSAHEVLDCGYFDSSTEEIPVLVIGERANRYGLAVDRMLGERELVVQPLDPRLGKVRDISAAALMEDGAPVLIFDVESALRSIDRLVAENRPALPRSELQLQFKPALRVLVADDSPTVRELERALLAGRGYAVSLATDGVDAWNALRAGHFDLVITDVDMPRLDGIGLTRLIKQDSRFHWLPVLIVSYKEGDEDRMRGLDAGADYYLAKGDFQEEKLLRAVADLIGEPAA